MENFRKKPMSVRGAIGPIVWLLFSSKMEYEVEKICLICFCNTSADVRVMVADALDLLVQMDAVKLRVSDGIHLYSALKPCRCSNKAMEPDQG